MKRVARTSVSERDHEYATRAIGQLLHDRDALETSFADVVKTIRLFTEDDEETDILQQALLRVFSRNLKLRGQLLRIAHRPHASGSNERWHHGAVQPDSEDSEERDDPQMRLGSARAEQRLESQVLVTRAAPTVATQLRRKRTIRPSEADDSEPVVSAGADIPTALASCEVSAEALDMLLLQKLIMNVAAESAAPADTDDTTGKRLPG